MGNLQSTNFVSKEEASHLFNKQKKVIIDNQKKLVDENKLNEDCAKFLANARICYEKKEDRLADCAIKNLPDQLPSSVQYDLCQKLVLAQIEYPEYISAALTCLTKGPSEAEYEVREIMDRDGY